MFFYFKFNFFLKRGSRMVKKQLALAVIIGALTTHVSYAAQHDDTVPTTDLVGNAIHQEAITRTLSPINSHISNIQMLQSLVNAPQTAALNRATGLSAGDTVSGISLWGSTIYTDFEDDDSNSKYDGDGLSVSIGADKSFMDGKLISGLSLAYDDSETDSDFNSGGTDTDSFTISPYVSYMINDTYGLDFSAGWGEGDTDLHRNDILGDKNTGSQDSDHYFYSAGVSGNHWLKNFSLGWRVGYYHSWTRYDSYTETNKATGTTTKYNDSSNTIGQIAASGQVGYYLTSWMPYFKLVYENEVSHSDPVAGDDDDGFVWELGANFFGTGSLSGGVSVSTISGRGSYDNTTAMGRLSYSF
jgi:hypothetical protein